MTIAVSQSDSNLNQKQVRRKRTFQGDLAKPNTQFQYQPHPNSHRTSVRANPGGTREPRTSKKQSLVSRLIICTVSNFPMTMRRSRGQKGECARPRLPSRLFSGRLSPMNLWRPSSFATAKAPEAFLGSEEGGNATLHSANTSAPLLLGRSRD